MRERKREKENEGELKKASRRGARAQARKRVCVCMPCVTRQTRAKHTRETSVAGEKMRIHTKRKMKRVAAKICAVTVMQAGACRLWLANWRARLKAAA